MLSEKSSQHFVLQDQKLSRTETFTVSQKLIPQNFSQPVNRESLLQWNLENHCLQKFNQYSLYSKF